MDLSIWPRAGDYSWSIARGVRSRKQLRELGAEEPPLFPHDVLAIRVSWLGIGRRKAARTWGFQDAGGQPDPLWALLGYDIATSGFLSGICSCGYEEHEWEELRARWLPATNRFGLFREEAAAAECLPQIDKLVPEHAPFHVFGLWLVR